MSRELRALLIDDSELDTELLVGHLEVNDYRVDWRRVDTADALRGALAEREWDVALCDYVMPRLGGPEALAILRSEAPDLPAITVSGNIGEEYAVNVMRAGAQDYVRKDNLARLIPAIERELADAAVRQQRKGLEAALQRSQARFREMFEEAPLGIGLIDSISGRIYDANRRYAEIVGRSRTEITAMDWMALTHPNDVQANLDNLARLIAGDIPGYTMQKRFVRPDGSVVWAQLTVAPMATEDLSRPRHLCMVEDITERRQAERALQESEQRFGELIDALPHLVWLSAADGPCEHVSKQWVEYTGVPEADQLGYGYLTLVHADDRADLAAAWRRATEAGAMYDTDYRLRRADGVYRWFKVRAVPLRDGDSKIVRWLGTSTDIDDQKRVEEELRVGRDH